jgi:hypothetical protein
MNRNLAIATTIGRKDFVAQLTEQGSNLLECAKALRDPLCLMVAIDDSAMTAIVLAMVQSRFATMPSYT